MAKEPEAFRPGEIDLAALAVKQPRSTSFAERNGGASVASSEIDLAELSPSARSVERLIPESSASQTAVPPSCGLSGKIDLEAIAIRAPRRRYWRDPAKVQATRRRNIAARQKQALEVWTGRRRASWEPSRGGPARWYSRTLGERLLCVMEPGEEGYALGDLTELLGVHRNSVKPLLYGAGGRRLVGLVEKCRNRAFKARLDPWTLMSGVKCEPEFLWRLTKAGERARELALMLE
jgi:hypothetical protein